MVVGTFQARWALHLPGEVKILFARGVSKVKLPRAGVGGDE